MNKYLIKMHTHAADFHIGEAKGERRKAALHETAAKETYKFAGQIVSDCHKSLAGEHEDCAQRHEDQAEYHIKCAKALGVDTHDDSRGTDVLRAAADSEPFGMFAARDFKSVRPDGVHLALPDIASTGNRLIPRPGGPPISEEDPTEQIDQFAHSPGDIKKAFLGQ